MPFENLHNEMRGFRFRIYLIKILIFLNHFVEHVFDILLNILILWWLGVRRW